MPIWSSLSTSGMAAGLGVPQLNLICAPHLVALWVFPPQWHVRSQHKLLLILVRDLPRSIEISCGARLGVRCRHRSSFARACSREDTPCRHPCPLHPFPLPLPTQEKPPHIMWPRVLASLDAKGAEEDAPSSPRQRPVEDQGDGQPAHFPLQCSRQRQGRCWACRVGLG